jgi:DNA gyrase subunit A
MGRATTGVRGVSLQDGDEVIGMVVMKEGNTLLVVTEKGMGKRTGIEAYRLQRRGGKGVINVRTTDKTGLVVAIKEVRPGDELMVITREGIVNRQSVDGIRVIGRNTQGVRLINLTGKDVVMDVARVDNEERAVDGNGASAPAAVVPIPVDGDGGPVEPGDDEFGGGLDELLARAEEDMDPDDEPIEDEEL